MKAIRIQNLRSIRDSGYIQIKPLNIVLGKNSSGKSTFLRTFPLLKQSIKQSLRGPLQWFNHSSVDFGDYDIAKNRHANISEFIKFGFQLTPTKRYNRRFRFGSYSNFYSSLTEDITFEISINKDSKGTFINGITIRFENSNIILDTPRRDDLAIISINGESFAEKLQIKCIQKSGPGIIPHIVYKQSDKEYIPFDYYMSLDLINKVKSHCDKRLRNTEKIFDIFRFISSSNKDDLLDKLKKQNIIPSLKNNVSNWSRETKEFLEIYNTWLLMQLPSLLEMIDDNIKAFFTNVKYIAPTRAEALRFYRNQDLEVSEVDAYGKNLQEFISSLSNRNLSSLQKFTNRALDVKVSVSNSMSHQSINLEDNKGNTYNLTDVGFGYSQILPIIVILWDAIFNKSSKNELRQYHLYDNDNAENSLCIVIEQPELHLHPAMQAKIADVFIESIRLAKEQNVKLSLILETHSPTIVNRLGRRISEGIINTNEMQVLLFDKEAEYSYITTTQFTDSGQIKNWPLGFFEP